MGVEVGANVGKGSTGAETVAGRDVGVNRGVITTIWVAVGVIVGVDNSIVAVCTFSSLVHAKGTKTKLHDQNAAAPCRRTRRVIKLTWFRRT